MNIEEIVDSGFTVQQLMDLLEGQDPAAHVFFTCPYGNYGNTIQALPVSDCYEAEKCNLRTSAYSQSGLALIEEGDEDGDTSPIVILSS